MPFLSYLESLCKTPDDILVILEQCFEDSIVLNNVFVATYLGEVV